MKTCRYCQQPIDFIRTANGRHMPVEINPITVITPEGKTIKKAFIPHFGNCNRQGERPEPGATRPVDPDSRAAYAHWNEDAERVYYDEHPEVFRPSEPDDYDDPPDGMAA